MFRLFAELIAKHLDAGLKMAATESALQRERADAELREQFSCPTLNWASRVVLGLRICGLTNEENAS